jgi:hypothetical protein
MLSKSIVPDVVCVLLLCAIMPMQRTTHFPCDLPSENEVLLSARTAYNIRNNVLFELLIYPVILDHILNLKCLLPLEQNI